MNTIELINVWSRKSPLQNEIVWLRVQVKKTVNMRRIRRGHSQTDIMGKKYMCVV